MRFATKDVVVPLAAVVLGAVGTYVVNRAQAKGDEEQEKRRQKKAYYEQLAFHLDATWAAFKNQAAARDRLAELLTARLGPLPEMEYEPLFRKYHPTFDDEEKFLCQLMRGITLTAMTQHNEAMNKLLRDNVQHSSELPEFQALREHLDLWLSKSAAMKDRPDTCLVYVGVAEKKDFPGTVRDSVAGILRGL
jgi:hypothetical protein